MLHKTPHALLFCITAFTFLFNANVIAGETTLVSRASNTVPTSFFNPKISADGRYVAFSSKREGADQRTSIFVHDRFLHKTQLVTRRYGELIGIDATGNRIFFMEKTYGGANTLPINSLGVYDRLSRIILHPISMTGNYSFDVSPTGRYRAIALY